MNQLMTALALVVLNPGTCFYCLAAMHKGEMVELDWALAELAERGFVRVETDENRTPILYPTERGKSANADAILQHLTVPQHGAVSQVTPNCRLVRRSGTGYRWLVPGKKYSIGSLDTPQGYETFTA
jgi:hypothetical protein